MPSNDKKNLTKWTSLLMFFVCAAVSIQASEPPKITLDELKKAVAGSQNAISTAHIVYIREKTDNEGADILIEMADTEDSRKIHEANRNVVTEEGLILDCKTKAYKLIVTDIRDANILLKDYNVRDNELNKRNLDTSRTLLYGNNYILTLFDSYGYLDESTGTGIMEPNFPNLGVIPERLLSYQDIRLSSPDGKLLKIELLGAGGNVEGTILCDPSIGYRFRKIQRMIGNTVEMEIISDDYKDINGIPYPFSYTSRLFDPETGNLRHEDKITIERAEFGINVSKDDFKVFIPKGTRINGSFSISPAREQIVTSKIRTGKKMGMDEIVTMGNEAVELYKAQYQKTQ